MADKNIFYLHELSDYKVASDYPDVRGWAVKDKDNKMIGKVDNLVVNKKAKRVVYLDVEVDTSIIDWEEPLSTPASEGVHGFRNKEGDNHLLIPIGLVMLDEENKIVTSNEIDHNTFKNASRYSKGNQIEPGYELMVYRHYVPSAGVKDTSELNDDFYNRKEFQRR